MITATYLMQVFDKANDAHFQAGNQPPIPKPRGTPLKTQITSKLEDYNDSGYGGSPLPGMLNSLLSQVQILRNST